MSQEPDLKHLIPLTDLVTALRAQLLEAQTAATGQDLRFEVAEVELELTVATTQEHAGGVGIKFWAVSADARAKEIAALTHKVKLKLKPGTPEDDLRISRAIPRPD